METEDEIDNNTNDKYCLVVTRIIYIFVFTA